MYGYAGTNVGQICLEYNISKGRMYHYFTSKDDLFLACAKEFFQKMEDWLDVIKMRPYPRQPAYRLRRWHSCPYPFQPERSYPATPGTSSCTTGICFAQKTTKCKCSCTSSKYGRVIKTRPEWDIRLYTDIPRDTEAYKNI